MTSKHETPLYEESRREFRKKMAFSGTQFFNIPENFEKDVVTVADRAALLAWAYGNLRCNNNAHVIQLIDLANLFFEVIGRDARNVVEMAEFVREERIDDRVDLKATEGEYDSALDMILRERALKGGFRRRLRDALEKLGTPNDEVEEIMNGPEMLLRASQGWTTDAVEALREEIAGEFGKRLDAERGVKAGAGDFADAMGA